MRSGCFSLMLVPMQCGASLSSGPHVTNHSLVQRRLLGRDKN